MKYVIRSTNPATKLSAIVSGGPYDTRAEAEAKRTNLATEEQIGSSKRYADVLQFAVEEVDSVPVQCLDCGWEGHHQHGPIQGARCPVCAPRKGRIVRSTPQEATA